ncbi:MAG: YXWGXW repeat-containing protein [Alphaproteobacteria bacterium]|nr:YXWGXW repeat-containing protein [Alphaproteobacteria bacterium]
MIRYVVPAAVVAAVLATPALAQTAPPPVAVPAPSMMTSTSVTTQTPGEPVQPYAEPVAAPAMTPPQPMPGPYMQPGFTPRTVWIPGAYEWDPVRQNYVWSDGRFVEAPTDTVQWVPGHWQQTPTAWIWIEGRWM